jgi:signal transduction histidine kinase
MIREVWRPTVVIGGLLLMFTYLLIGGASPDPTHHERILTALHALVREDATLQRDLLRARTGLLRTYDPLVRTVNGLRAALAVLQDVGDAGDAAEAAGRARPLADLVAAVETREALVEDFKSRNALLQNSLAYFARAGHEIGRLTGDGQDSAAAATVALTTAMFRFLGDPRPPLAAEVMAALNRVDRRPAAPPPHAEVQAMVVHGRLIAVTLPLVDADLDRLLDGSLSGAVRGFQDLYLDRHGRAETRAQIFRLLMYLAALVLLGYLAVLFARLRRTARALRVRLGLEHLTAEISSQFINLPGERVDDGIRAQLARLAEGLAVDRAVIHLGDGKTYAAGRDAAASAGRSDPMAAQWGIAGCERQGCIHVPCVAALPPGPERAALAARGVRSWLCVPMRAGGQRIGVLELAMVRREKHWPDDDIALLRLAGEIFANTLERARSAAEKEALEARLHQAQRVEAIGTLAGGIAHNFNNILGAILGYAEMAQTGVPEGSPPWRHLGEVLRAGGRAREVVDQILAFGRRGDPERRLVSLAPLIEEAIRLLRATLPSTVRIRTTVAAGDLAVRADAAQVQQVVVNLCTNAAQAMEGQGTLEIGVDRAVLTGERTLSHGTLPAGAYIRMRVRDTGHGMDRPTLERIFEPFFTTKPAGTGTGLGLSSVHGIVADHGGALNVLSQPGAGSVFEAYLPQADTAATPAEPDRAQTAPPRGGRGETILLVDDEMVLVRLGEDMLAALGYEPVGFNDGAAALAAFRADPARFDLMLTDEVMPGMTGSQLAAAVHQIRPDLPIVLMTGHQAPAGPHRLTATGIRAVLRKPLLARDLVDCLGRWLHGVGSGYV